MADQPPRGLSLVVRSMGEGDLPQVLQIEAMSYSHPWTRAQFLEELGRHPFSRCLVAEAASAEGGPPDLCAYVLAWEVAGQLHITNLAVHPEFRRRGAARLILERLFSDARADGATWCTLEVRVGNLAARSLYEGLGFAAMGTRRRYYPGGEDALVLTRAL